MIIFKKSIIESLKPDKRVKRKNNLYKPPVLGWLLTMKMRKRKTRFTILLHVRLYDTVRIRLTSRITQLPCDIWQAKTAKKKGKKRKDITKLSQCKCRQH